MARTTIKVTYSLSPEIVGRLEQLALTWRVSKSAALSRAISDAADATPLVDPCEALNALQQCVPLTATEVEAWTREARAERRRSTRGRTRANSGSSDAT